MSLASLKKKIYLGGCLLVAGFTMISGCGSSPSNINPPVELKPITQTLEVKISWAKSVAEASENSGNIRPAVSGESIYLSSGASVYAMENKSGKTRWTAALEDSISSGVAADSSIVVASTHGGDLVALNAENGAQRWRKNIGAEVLGLPAIANGSVIVQTVDGRIEALSTQHGKRQWVYEKTVPALSLRGDSGVVYRQGLVVAAFASGHIVGLDSRNGRAIWERVVSYPKGRSDVERLVDVDATPLIVGYTLYAVSYQGQLVALDLRNGQILWNRALSSYLSFAADTRNLYIVNDQGIILAIDQASGADRWVQNDLERRITTGVAINDNYLVVGDFEGYVHLLDVENGNIIARKNLGGGRVLGHLADAGYLYTSSASKTVAYTAKRK